MEGCHFLHSRRRDLELIIQLPDGLLQACLGQLLMESFTAFEPVPVNLSILTRGTLSAIALGDNQHFPEHTAKMLHLGRLPFNQWSIQYQSVGNRCEQTNQHLQLIIQSPNGL